MVVDGGGGGGGGGGGVGDGQSGKSGIITAPRSWEGVNHTWSCSASPQLDNTNSQNDQQHHEV